MNAQWVADSRMPQGFRPPDFAAPRLLVRCAPLARDVANV
jgi:hypothetical protein